MLKIPAAGVNEAFRACLSVFCCKVALRAQSMHKKTAAACAQRFFVEGQSEHQACGRCLRRLCHVSHAQHQCNSISDNTCACLAKEADLASHCGNTP